MSKAPSYGITEHRKASIHRREDAGVLLDGERWRGCMYLAGYSVECLLKAKLMRMFDCRHLRELEEELLRRGLLPSQSTVFTHQLAVLLRMTQRMEVLRRNPALWNRFNLVNRWVPAWRYTVSISSRDDAEDFLQAVDVVRQWIDQNM